MIDEVPGYRVLDQAGEGGFSVVYRAHQERLDRIVALKVLSVDAVDDATMRRFQRECQITGRLTGHPNVVTVLDTGMTSGGRPYIAMEYFEHGSLRDRLSREGPLSVADVLRAGVKIASALAAVHHADVLHRDVKPQNILLSRYGEPALADFGVARLVDSFDATHTNAFTPHHAAPEVVNGEQPGVASDIYSLGSTMYQLLAGAPAFKGNTETGIGRLVMRIVNEPPPPISRPDLPAPAFEPIRQSMAKDPASRPATAMTFATLLQQAQAGLGLPITEIAGGAAVTAPPAAPGGGLIGPAPHTPVAHPFAMPAPGSSTTPPADSEPSVPPFWMPQAQAPGASAPVPGPPVDAPAPAAPAQPSPPVAQWPQPPAGLGPQQPFGLSATGSPDNAGPGNRGMLLAGILAVVLIGTGIGVGGLLLFRPSSSTDPPAPTPTAPSTKPTASKPPAVPPAVIAAARPRHVRVQDNGSSVTLRWKLGTNKKSKQYPITVQQAPGHPDPYVLPKATTFWSVTGLDARKGYCFKVGAIVAFGQPSTVAWSEPVCIRGATVRPSTG